MLLQEAGRTNKKAESRETCKTVTVTKTEKRDALRGTCHPIRGYSDRNANLKVYPRHQLPESRKAVREDFIQRTLQMRIGYPSSHDQALANGGPDSRPPANTLYTATFVGRSLDGITFITKINTCRSGKLAHINPGE